MTLKRQFLPLLILCLFIAPAWSAQYQVDLLIYADRDAAQGTAGELASEPTMTNFRC